MGIKQLRSNKGFTLVEIIVTLSIFAIILTVGGTVYFQGNRMFTTTAVKNTEKSIGDNMYAFMRERLIYATKLQVIDPLNPNQEPENKNAKVFKLNDAKHLELSGKDIYGNDYYSGYTVSYNVDIPKNDEGKYSADQLNLTVYVKKGDEIVYQTGSTIKNLNLIPQNSSIEIKQATKPPISEPPYDNPVIVFEEDVSSGIVFAPIELRQYCMEVNRQVLAYINSSTDKNKRDKSLLPDWWIEYCNNPHTKNNIDNVPNDVIRQYVLMRYYRKELGSKNNLNDYWPSFPGFDESVIQKADEQINELNKKHGTSDTTLLSKFFTKHEKNDFVLMCYTFKSVTVDIPLDNESGEKKKIAVTGDNSSFVYVAPRIAIVDNVNSGWTANFVYDFEEGTWYYYYRKGSPNNFTNNSILNTQWSDEEIIPGSNITYKEFYKKNGVIEKPGIKESIHNDKYWVKIENK